MKAAILAIICLLGFRSQCRAGAPNATLPASAPTTLPSGEPDFWQVAENGRGIVVAYERRMPGKVLNVTLGENGKMRPMRPGDVGWDAYAGSAAALNLRAFETRFYLIGSGGPASLLWEHSSIAPGDGPAAFKTYAALATSDVFIVVYEDDSFLASAGPVLRGVAMRSGADHAPSAGTPLRGSGLTRAGICGPSADGTFTVIVGDSHVPKSRYSVAFSGLQANWRWDAVWDAGCNAWRGAPAEKQLPAPSPPKMEK